MSTLTRTITINPIEPAPLSFRIPGGIDMALDLRYRNQNDSPLTVDVAGQLHLTGRSTARTQSFLAPATDIVNGRARVSLPANTLSDPNGYRVQLLGTVDGDAMLLARGHAALIDSGPFTPPVDEIDTVDLVFTRDEDVSLDVTVWTDDSKSAAYDLTAEHTALSANVYNAKGGSVLVPFGVTVLSANSVRLTLTVDQVNVLPDTCWWSLIAATGAGATMLCEGTVTLTGTIVPPFTDVIANWNYTKQDSLDVPATGGVLHANYALDTLRIHQFDADAIDRAATLDRMVVGDQIIVGVTTWSIQSISKAGADWYDVLIAPNVQAVVSGLQPFTLHRP